MCSRRDAAYYVEIVVGVAPVNSIERARGFVYQ
jgi:hypothetical protein